jgi:DNA processing protein
VSLELPGAWPPGFAGRDRDRDALLVLAHLQAMTPRELHALGARVRTGAACLDAVRAGVAATANDRELAAAVDPQRVREDLDRCGARPVFPGEEEYPPQLLGLPDPPAWLFVRGRSTAAWPAAVAIVGARDGSAYGREVAGAIGSGAATAGVVVVSGAARGIDAAAHHGALRAGGATAAVLGSGIDVPYPRGNRSLLERIAATGWVFSEYPPGVPAAPRRFPARNRIVAGLSEGVVVVEGGPDSGALITANFAVDMNRVVMGVPGPVTSPLSEAPHSLIRDGAALVRGPEDVLGEIGEDARMPGCEADELSTHELRVLRGLAGTAATLDALSAASGLPPGQALVTLTSLELRGLVRSVGGRYERRIMPNGEDSGVPG